MLIPADLCSPCSDAVRVLWTTGKTFAEVESHRLRHELMQTLQHRGGHRCPLCTWMALRFNNTFLVDQSGIICVKFALIGLFGFYGQTRTSYQDGKHNTMSIQISVSDRSIDGAKYPLVISFYPEPSEYPIVIASTTTTASESTFALAKGWILDCATSHKSCPNWSSWHPTRLLYLSASDDGCSHARLVESPSEDIPNGAKYLTLSHRWLPDERFRLLKKNFHSCLTTIPLMDVKASIRDAISISLRLGFQYLWIDSLCIIQDDPEDKRREISEMDLVYGNSACTLAASWASTYDEGCYTTRAKELVSNYVVRLSLGQEAPDQHRLCLSWDNTPNESKESILKGRAWIYQEEFLSARTLYYGKEQVLWRCNKFPASETYPGGIDGSVDRRLARRAGRVLHRLNSQFLFACWREVVESYTAMDLTYAEDRLPGIEGVALFYQQAVHRKDTYVAGLWKSTLPKSLLWRTMYRDTDETTRIGSSRREIAPSWSWASVSRRVSYSDLETLEPLFFHNAIYKSSIFPRVGDFVDLAEVMWSGDAVAQSTYEAFRQASDLKTIRLLGRPWNTKLHDFVCEENEIEHDLCMNPDPSTTEPFPPDGKLSLIPDLLGEWESIEVLTVTMLPVVRQRKPMGDTWPDPGRQIVGLILVPAQDTPNLVYRRIGLFKISFDDGWTLVSRVQGAARQANWMQQFEARPRQVVCIC